jgi:hypothetical protein
MLTKIAKVDVPFRDRAAAHVFTIINSDNLAFGQHN